MLIFNRNKSIYLSKRTQNYYLYMYMSMRRCDARL